MARLDVDVGHVSRQTRKLQDLLSDISSLQPSHQKVVCELVLLRQFAVLEERIRSISLKLLCGTPYCDGTVPVLVQRASSILAAERNVREFGRNRPLSRLRWTSADAIRGQLRHLVDGNDPFFAALTAHEALLDEMRRVRHHIAHFNSDTRRKYRPVVEKYYGAYVRNVTPGVLLVSPRQSPALIHQYLVAARVMIRDLARSSV
jgi:hypothetical protein